MSLLGDISKEQDRLVEDGYAPIVIWVNSKTHKLLNLECEDRLGHICKTLYGMEVREDISLPDGVFRINVTLESSRDFRL